MQLLKKKISNHYIIRYLAVGLFNTGFGYIIYMLLNLLFDYKFAYTLSVAVGIVLSFFLNSKIVFKTKITVRKFISFPLVYFCQYLIGFFSLSYFVDDVGVSEWIAPLCILLITIPIGFLGSRFILRDIS
ncbi:GtrA family protein [Enterovibrio norvegicus]|uniref:GtrA family protein n=1 Tax=Enterovibrio norvegicus TaxID=188144 RepID=UPI00352D39F8